MVGQSIKPDYQSDTHLTELLGWVLEIFSRRTDTRSELALSDLKSGLNPTNSAVAQSGLEKFMVSWWLVALNC